MSNNDLDKKSMLWGYVAHLNCLDKYCLDKKVAKQVIAMERKSFLDNFKELRDFGEYLWTANVHSRDPERCWDLYEDIAPD